MQFRGSLIPCRLCGSPPEEHVVYATRDRRMRPLRTVRCPRCDLVFSNPMPTDEELDRFYRAEYRTLYKGSAGPQPHRILRAARAGVKRARLLSRLVDPGAAVLDIGSGGGETIYAMRRLGYDAQGIEPGADYAEFAGKAYGVDVHVGPYRTFAGREGGFDAVTSFHVLEHLPDPSVFFAFAKSQLRPGGVMLVEVPDIATAHGSFRGRFHMAHVHHFSGATLKAFAAKSGFSPLGSHARAEDPILVMSFVNGPVAGRIARKPALQPAVQAAKREPDEAAEPPDARRRLIGRGWLGIRWTLLRRTLNERRFVWHLKREDIARAVLDTHLERRVKVRKDRG